MLWYFLVCIFLCFLAFFLLAICMCLSCLGLTGFVTNQVCKLGLCSFDRAYVSDHSPINS